MICLRDLVELDKLDSAESLHFNFERDQILMLPFVRFDLVEKVVSNYFKQAYPHSNIDKMTVLYYLRYAVNTIVKSPFYVKSDIPIIMFSSGVVNVKNVDGGYVNRLYDLFACEYESKTMLIEDSFRLKYFLPREFPNVRYHDILKIETSIESKFVRENASDIKNINHFVQYLKSILPIKPDDEIWGDVKLKLMTYSRKLPILHRKYEQLFCNTTPRIIFLEEGSYGGRSYILKWARDKGITTAEFQHGVVSRNQPAYNYGKHIWGSAYESYLPEYLLTFGQYWNEQIETPSKTVAVGSPFLCKIGSAQAEHKRDGESDRKIVLFISSGTAPDLAKKIVIELSEKLNKRVFDIVFRPHPGERPLVRDRYSELFGIGIDFSYENIYDMLPKVECIVSVEASCVNFEAMMFTKKIYLLESEMSQYHVGSSAFLKYSNTDDLVRFISAGKEIDHGNEYYWEVNWQKRYRDFVDTVLRLN